MYIYHACHIVFLGGYWVMGAGHGLENWTSCGHVCEYIDLYSQMR